MLNLDLKEVLIQLSIEQGLEKAARLIKKICGGEISEIRYPKNRKNKKQ